MEREFDAIVSVLGARLLEIPEARLREACALVDADPDRSLVDTLSEIGVLNPEERAMFDALSAEFRRHDATTLAGPAPPGTALAELGRIRAAAHQLRESDARYAVRGEHARGGMGRIFKVWDRRMHREVALKEVLPADGEAGGRMVARFLREARITGRLQHPSIIPVHEIGVRDSGAFYYTMKLVRGRTLRQAIKDAANLEERLALLPHFVDLCQAMAYAHAHGVIHRDLKPGNVMIGEFGETQVIDWGLAKELGAPDGAGIAPSEHETGQTEADGTDLTQLGQLLGTPHYMAPEQAAGRHDELDARADVYSLGAVLYELLTGERPYRASTGPEALIMAAKEPPAPPETICPDAPPALVAICRRAMARQAEDRYASAGELALEVQNFQAGQRVSAYHYTLAEIISLFVQRNRAAVVTACVGVMLLLSLGAYAYLSLRTRHAAEQVLRQRSEQRGYDMSMLLAQRAIDDRRYQEAHHLLDAAPPDLRQWEWGRLGRLLNDLKSHVARDQGAIVDARLLDGGKQIATLGKNGTVQLRALPDGALVRTFATVGGPAWAIAVHPQSEELAILPESGGVLRWKLSTGRELPGMSFAFGNGDALAYARDGKSILVNMTGGRLGQWSLARGVLERTFETDGSIIHDLDTSPDGRWLAAGTNLGGIFVWDWATGALVFSSDAHANNRQNGVQGTLWLAFSSDGRLLATGGCDALARLWSTADWSLRHTLEGHNKKVVAGGFSPDGSRLVTHSDRTTRLWNTETGEELPCWIRSNRSFRHTHFSEDGKHLLSAGDGEGITIWNLDAPVAGHLLAGHTSEVNTVRFTPDSRFLLSGAGQWLEGGDSRVLKWDLTGPEGRPRPEPAATFTVGGRWVNQVGVEPGGRLFSAAEADGNIVTWDLGTGEEVRKLAIPEYTRGARCVVYSPDGALLATAGWGEETLKTVLLLRARDGARLHELSGPWEIIDSLSFSPDGSELAGGCRDGRVYIWKVASGQLDRSFELSERWVYGVAFSPQGGLLAASCDSSAVLLLESGSGTVRHRLEGLGGRADKVCFSPDGHRVAACDTSFVRVWNVDTGAPLMTMPFGAADVAFSPDGLYLAAAGIDGRVGLWQAEPWWQTSAQSGAR